MHVLYIIMQISYETWGLFYKHGLILIAVSISNYIHARIKLK